MVNILDEGIFNVNHEFGWLVASDIALLDIEVERSLPNFASKELHKFYQQVCDSGFESSEVNLVHVQETLQTSVVWTDFEEFNYFSFLDLGYGEMNRVVLQLFI